MSDRIKLDEKDFSIESADHSGSKELKIRVKYYSIQEAMRLQQQILDDNVKVPKLESENQKLKYDRIDLINRCKNENDLKEKLEHIKKLITYPDTQAGSILKEILGGDSN